MGQEKLETRFGKLRLDVLYNDLFSKPSSRDRIKDIPQVVEVRCHTRRTPPMLLHQGYSGMWGVRSTSKAKHVAVRKKQCSTVFIFPILNPDQR